VYEASIVDFKTLCWGATGPPSHHFSAEYGLNGCKRLILGFILPIRMLGLESLSLLRIYS